MCSAQNKYIWGEFSYISTQSPIKCFLELTKIGMEWVFR